MYKYYLKINPVNGIVEDCLVNEYQGYVLYEGEIPSDIMGGYYKLENGVIVEVSDLKPKPENDKIKTLEEITAEHEAALVEAFELIAQLMEGGNE